MPAAKIQNSRRFSGIVPPISLCKGVEANGLSANVDAVWASSTSKRGKNQDQNKGINR